jgi:hypothetical protein
VQAAAHVVEIRPLPRPRQQRPGRAHDDVAAGALDAQMREPFGADLGDRRHEAQNARTADSMEGRLIGPRQLSGPEASVMGAYIPPEFPIRPPKSPQDFGREILLGTAYIFRFKSVFIQSINVSIQFVDTFSLVDFSPHFIPYAMQFDFSFEFGP